MKTKKIKFVQLEPGAFLTDPDFVAMTPAERGIYISLILALYCNGGSLKFDKNLGKLCGCSYANFIQYFAKISFKFREKNGKIFHKKVSKVLAAQKKFMQNAYISGLKGARVTWGAHGNENENENETRTKNENINYSNSKSNDSLNSDVESTAKKSSDLNSSNSTKDLSRSSNSPRTRVEGIPFDKLRTGLPSNSDIFELKKSVSSNSIKFLAMLNKILYAKTRADRTCFNNVTDYLSREIYDGKFNLEIFDRAIELAKEAKSGENPNALFMSLMRSQLGYERIS